MPHSGEQRDLVADVEDKVKGLSQGADDYMGTSNNDDFVVGLSAAAMSLLIWRGCASASCARRPIQGASGGLLRHAMAIRSSVTSRRML